MKKAKFLWILILVGLLAMMGCPNPTTDDDADDDADAEEYVGDAVAEYVAANYYVLADSGDITIDLDESSELYIWEGTLSLEDVSETGSGVPEGSSCMKVTHGGGTWAGAGFNLGGDAAVNHDLSGYTNLVFYMLANADEFNGDFKVAVDTVQYTVPAGDFTADGTWQKVTVPLTNFGAGLAAVEEPFSFVIDTRVTSDIYYLDYVYFE